MFVKYIRALLFVLFFILCSPSHGEEITLTLEEAIESALENNHSLSALRKSLSAAESRVGIERSYLLPSINFEERFTRTDNPTNVFAIKLNQERFSQSDFEISGLNDPDAVNDFQTTVSVEQPLLEIKSILGLKRAKDLYNAERSDLERSKQELVFKVIDTYVLIQSATEFVEVRRKSVEDAKQHLKIAESRYKSELGLLSDKLRASTAVTAAEQKHITATKNLEVAKRALGVLIGTTVPVNTSDDTLSMETRSIDYYLENSRNRKDINAIEHRLRGAEKQVDIAFSGYIPSIGLLGSYQLNDRDVPFGSEGDSWNISAYLRWNIFDGWKRESEIAEAKHRVSELEHNIESLLQNINFNVNRSFLEVENSRKNLQLARESLESAREGTRLVRVRYENSLSPFVDLLDAQLNLDIARVQVIARKNELITAIARLNLESGTLFKELGINNDPGNMIE